MCPKFPYIIRERRRSSFKQGNHKENARGKKHGKSALQSHKALVAFSVRPHFPGYFIRGRKEAEGRKNPK